MIQRSRRLLAALGLVALTSVSVTACGGTDNSTAKSGSSSGFDLSKVKKDDAAASLLPADLKSKGTLTVGTDTTYPPNEYIADDGKTIIGMDIDLIKAVGKKLGVQMEPKTAAFETIIPSIGSNFDLAISSFTINAERMKVVDFVSYYNAGTVWAVKKGGKVNPDDACGKKVAVQTGTIQDTDDLPAKNQACTAAGKPAIDIQKYDSQGDATTAVVTGKADAMLADLPVVVDAITTSNGELEQAGKMYDAAPYGIALPKGKGKLADAVLGAVKSLMDDGSYDKILKKWKADAGALKTPEINPSGG
ncbi:ABC transporter substrate-binding protein [Cumulibacter manganitolerans]|uniref:ABC transporter substrate-binding protein n=1 Tax=Cumulibacter manganitolerans TaxID=1884992 RepID=UPI00129579F2|nr:ABC transporter substrate-binding protein [Cumulibacter manganitolerans]